MFRKRGENLHSIFIFLFLTVALFFLEHQDESKFARLFAFDGSLVKAGEWWRVVSFQFTQAGQTWGFIPKPVFLFFTLLILYLMGDALEEEWGTAHFVGFFMVSTLVTAALGGWLGVPLLGSFFVRYTLLFVYAAVFPEQTFYLFAVLPIRVRWLSYITMALLVYAAFAGDPANIAVLGGAVAGYVYFLLNRATSFAPVPAAPVEARTGDAPDFTAVRNAARFVGIKKALAGRSAAEIDKLITQCDHDKVAGVNVCPPADYKPEAADGYCIRCEGFAECSARFMRLNRPQPAPPNAIPDATR